MTKDKMKKRTKQEKIPCQWCGKMLQRLFLTHHLRGSRRLPKCPNYKYTDGISEIARDVLLDDDEYPGTNGEEWAAGYPAAPGENKGVSLGD